jgi:hypothetical protein
MGSQEFYMLSQGASLLSEPYNDQHLLNMYDENKNTTHGSSHYRSNSGSGNSPTSHFKRYGGTQW